MIKLTKNIGEISGMGEEYILPQATSAALGGIKADEKTENETVEVKINTATGKLFAPAGSVGMINPMIAEGDLIIGGVDGVPTKLSKGEEGQVLGIVNGVLQYKNSSDGGGGESVPTLTWHTGTTGTTLTASEIEGKTLIKVFKNGMLLQEGSGNDYSISGTVITFEIALLATDKITTEAY